MDSGELQTSTPLQRRCDSGFGNCRTVYDASKITELSPIRKQPPFRSALAKAFINGAGKTWYKAIDKVGKKLIFTSPDATKSNSVNRSADSGIVVDASKSNSVNSSVDSGIVADTEKSLTEELAIFPTDENCNNIISSDSNIGYIRCYQPYKYICTYTENQNEIDNQSLKKELKSISSSYSFRFLDDSTDEVQKTAPKLDLLYELHIRNCTAVLSEIFSHLSGKDLRLASYVSKQWQNIIFSDKNANERRRTYIENKRNAASGPNKENSFQKSSVGRSHKSAFTSVINDKNETLQSLVYDNFSGRFDSFIEEVKVLKREEHLMKCPKCRYPSKRTKCKNKFCCTRILCQHEFCEKCLGPYLDNHLCLVPELNDNFTKVIIGSKKSKKNLKRL